MDAVDMIDPGLALAPYTAAARSAAVAVPDQGEAAQGFPFRAVVEAVSSAWLSHVHHGLRSATPVRHGADRHRVIAIGY